MAPSTKPDARNLSKESLLAEIEDVLRQTPPRPTIRHELPENFEWLGRLSAAIGKWDPSKLSLLSHFMDQFHSPDAHAAAIGYRRLMTLIQQARHDLRIELAGPSGVAFPGGSGFQYFDEVRKVIQSAAEDLFFVDPYLDAQFVSRFMPQAKSGVFVRLLTRRSLGSLLPAIELFASDSGMNIEVRSSEKIHDRYLFVDKVSCYQSGASFKDGARVSPTTLTEITDAFSSVLKTYEDLWTAGTKCYPK